MCCKSCYEWLKRTLGSELSPIKYGTVSTFSNGGGDHHPSLRDDDNDDAIEFASMNNRRRPYRDHAVSEPTIYMNKDMSQRTIILRGGGDDNNNIDNETITGHGLVLADVSINHHDSVYWEWHIINNNDNNNIENDTYDDEPSSSAPSSTSASSAYIKIGISTKRTQQFYDMIKGNDGDSSSLILATKMMRSIPTSATLSGDVIGVALSFNNTDNKKSGIVQLYRNGIKIENYNFDRFRGQLYPSLWLPNNNNNTSIEVKFVHKDIDLKQHPTAAASGSSGSNKFVPIKKLREP